MLACEVENMRLEMVTSAGTKKSHDRSSERPLVEDNHLQVALIRRYREGQTDARVQCGIHISINRITAGLRNTG